MSSFVPGSSPSHEERVLVPADNRGPYVGIIRAVPSSNILPIPSHLTLVPRQLLTEVNWGPRFKHYVLEPDALEAGRNPESITNRAGLSLGTGNLK